MYGSLRFQSGPLLMAVAERPSLPPASCPEEWSKKKSALQRTAGSSFTPPPHTPSPSLMLCKQPSPLSEAQTGFSLASCTVRGGAMCRSMASNTSIASCVCSISCQGKRGERVAGSRGDNEWKGPAARCVQA